MLIAVGCLAAAVTTLLVVPLTAATLLIMLGVGWQMLAHASAPALALIAERDLRRQGERPSLCDVSNPGHRWRPLRRPDRPVRRPSPEAGHMHPIGHTSTTEPSRQVYLNHSLGSDLEARPATCQAIAMATDWIARHSTPFRPASESLGTYHEGSVRSNSGGLRRYRQPWNNSGITPAAGDRCQPERGASDRPAGRVEPSVSPGQTVRPPFTRRRVAGRAAAHGHYPAGASPGSPRFLLARTKENRAKRILVRRTTRPNNNK
ncbi:hypothetical protein BKA01_005042 [Pseudonocardia eucalypti]|nr:hypothetical protein [Pseudonocardia eucalypti]